MLNKKTGFWIRLVVRLFDLILVSAIAVSFLFLIMNHSNGWSFKEDWMYYIWTLMYVAMLFMWFIIIPIYFGGQTLFMKLFRIKIIFNDNNKLSSMIKRELVFSIMWMFMLVVVALVINHTLISKYVSTKQDNISYSSFEKLRTGTVTAIGSILTVTQFVFAISIFVRGANKGLHDTQSNTWTVWKNKYIEKPKTKKKIKILPKPVNNTPVNWVN